MNFNLQTRLNSLVNKNYFWFTLTLTLILIDQLTKFAAAGLGWSIFLNDQFAFSLPVPTPLIFLTYIVVLVGMSYYVYSTAHRFSLQQKIAWAFVYAGGLSNILERIILGHVRDFIYLATGILNVADFFILLGLLLLIVSTRREQSSENL